VNALFPGIKVQRADAFIDEKTSGMINRQSGCTSNPAKKVASRYQENRDGDTLYQTARERQ
jgi:hypothetical protein